MRTSHCDQVAVPGDHSLAEISRRYVLFREEDIELFESSGPSLWKSEVGPDKGQDGETSSKESCLSFPVPGRWIQYVRRDRRVDDVQYQIRSAGKRDRLGPQSCTGNFTIDDVR